MKSFYTVCLILVTFSAGLVIGTKREKSGYSPSDITKILRRELKTAMRNPEFAQLIREG